MMEMCEQILSARKSQPNKGDLMNAYYKTLCLNK